MPPQRVRRLSESGEQEREKHCGKSSGTACRCLVGISRIILRFFYSKHPDCVDNKMLLPGHTTVDGEVEGVGKADDDVDEEDDVVHQLVVKELHKAVQV